METIILECPFHGDYPASSLYDRCHCGEIGSFISVEGGAQ